MSAVMFGQLVLSGLSHGAIYALVALSMTVLYRATTVVNFGHGDMVMAGAFVVYVFVLLIDIPYVPAALLALILMFALGVAVDRGLITAVRHGPHIALAMMSVAVGYFLRGAARSFWGREVLPMPSFADIPPLLIGDLILTGDAIIILSAVILLVSTFFVVLYRTNLGKLIQAVYQSERGAMLVGVNVPRFNAMMWGLAAVMGALGGMLIAPVTLLHPDMGANLLVHSFAAMTLGGFGSLLGAVVGGLLLGVAEQLLGAYVSTALIDVTAYIVIIAVLVIRPVGLFGRRTIIKI